MSKLTIYRGITKNKVKQWTKLLDDTQIDPGGPTDPPATLPMYIGTSKIAFDDLNSLITNDGSKTGSANSGLSICRSYDTGATMPASFSASQASGDPAKGVMSYWSWTPPSAFPGQFITSTSLQNTWKAFCNSWPANHSGLITIGHEPENNGYTLADFRSMQAMMHDIFVSSNIDRTRVKFGPLLTADSFRSGQQSQFFPSDPGKYDFVGVDGYEFWRPASAPVDPVLGTRGTRRSPSWIFGAAVAFAAQNNKPIVVGEYSLHPDPANVPDRPTRFQAMIDYFDKLTTTTCLAFMAYHSAAGAHGPWWFDCFHNYTNINDRSNTDPATLTKFRDIVAAHTKYTAGTPWS